MWHRLYVTHRWGGNAERAATGRLFSQNCPAVTYSPRGVTPKYHRRWLVSLPCSEWERVVPGR